MEQYCALIKERATFLNDLVPIGNFLYQEIANYDTDTIKKKWKPEIKVKFEEFISGADISSRAPDIFINEFITFTGLKTGEIMPVLRVALAGVLQGPPVVEMAKFLDTAGTTARLKKSFEYFETVH